MTEEDGIEVATGATESCEWCNGSGIEPDINRIDLTTEQVTLDDIAAIESAIGCPRAQWTIIDPRRIVAATCNHMSSVIRGNANEGRACYE